MNTVCKCHSTCADETQTLRYVQNPPGKSSSQYNMILTLDKSSWKTPTNEKAKYGSYVRVLRRRRGLLCCEKPIQIIQKPYPQR
jgi:hypothetical protein